MLGSVKGYNSYSITRKIVEKKKWSFDKLEKENKKIVEDILKVIDEGGEVFALGKKKVFNAVYLFKAVNENNGKVLVLDRKIVLDEVIDCVSEFEKDLETILGETVSSGQFKKAIIGEKEIEPSRVKLGKLEISVTAIWIVLGGLLSVLFDDFTWVCLGICFGISFGYVVKTNKVKITIKNKKRGDKKKISSSNE